MQRLKGKSAKRLSKVLLYGYFGYGNIGDEAICKVILDDLRAKHNTEAVILSADPERSSKLHGAESCRLGSIKFLQHLLSAHTVILAGGGRYGDTSLRIVSTLVLLAKLLRKKVIFRIIGVYHYRSLLLAKVEPQPFKSSLTRALVRMSFDLADEVTVRDRFSERVLRLSGVKRDIKVMEDEAQKLLPASLESVQLVLKEDFMNKERGRLVIGINLLTLTGMSGEKLKKIAANVLDWVVKNYDADIVFLPFGYGSKITKAIDDRIIAREIKECMQYKDKLRIVEVELTPEEALGAFRMFDLFLGMRFHSILFSGMMNVPTISVIYDMKVEEFIKQSGHNLQSIWINELDEEKLREMISNALGLQIKPTRS